MTGLKSSAIYAIFRLVHTNKARQSRRNTESLVALRECVARELERKDTEERFHEDLITALNLLRDASQNVQKRT